LVIFAPTATQGNHPVTLVPECPLPGVNFAQLKDRFGQAAACRELVTAIDSLQLLMKPTADGGDRRLSDRLVANTCPATPDARCSRARRHSLRSWIQERRPRLRPRVHFVAVGSAYRAAAASARMARGGDVCDSLLLV